MPDIANVLKDFTPGAYGIWTGVIMGLIYFLREWRENRKLSTEDKLARRDGYAKQVSMLMGENRKLMNDLATLRREHDTNRKECIKENDELRGMIGHLQEEIEALKLQGAKDEFQIAQLKKAGGQ